MSNGVLIEPLSPLISDELTEPLQPDFSSLVNDSLSGVATPDDGFDAVLTELVQIVDALEGALITLGGADGGDLDDAFLEISALDADAPGLDVANLAAAIPDVQTNVDNLGANLVGASLPAPVPACDVTLNAPDTFQGDPPTTYQLGIVNRGSTPLDVTAATFTTTHPEVLAVTVTTPQTVQPGAPLVGTITVTPTVQGGYSGTLTLTVTGLPRPEKVCFLANVVPPAAPPSGGGGGPSGVPGSVCIGVQRPTDIAPLCP